MTVVLLAATGAQTFAQTFAKAMALGSLYALLALGFVLIYKSTQTLNFSQGALAGTGLDGHAALEEVGAAPP